METEGSFFCRFQKKKFKRTALDDQGCNGWLFAHPVGALRCIALHVVDAVVLEHPHPILCDNRKKIEVQLEGRNFGNAWQASAAQNNQYR